MKHGLNLSFLRWLLVCLVNLPWLALSQTPHDVRINFTVSLPGGFTVDSWAVKDREYQGNSLAGTGVPGATYYPVRVYTQRTYYFRMSYRESAGGAVLNWTNDGPFTVTGGAYTSDQVFNIAVNLAPVQFTYTDCTTNKKNYPVVVQYWDTANPTAEVLKEKTLQPGETGCVTLGPWAAKKDITVTLYYPSSDVTEPAGSIDDQAAGWVQEGGTPVQNPGNRAEFALSYASGKIDNIDFLTGATEDVAKDTTLQAGFTQLKQVLVEDHREAMRAAAYGNGNLDLISTKATAMQTSLASLAGNEASKVSSLNTIAANTAAGTIQAQAAVTKLGSIETGQAVGNGYLSAISEKQTYGNGRLDAIYTKLGDQHSTLASIQNSAGAIMTDADESNTKLGYIKSAAESSDTKLGTLRDDTAIIKGHLYDSRTNANAMHQTMREQTNLLGQIAASVAKTNASGDGQGNLDTWNNAGQAAGNAARSPWDTFSPGTIPDEAGVADGFLVQFGQWSVNLNPATSPMIASAAAAVKTAITWFVTVAYLFACMGVLEKYLAQVGSVRQTAAPPVAILGFEIGPALAMPLAALITGILAALPAFGMQWIQSNTGFFDVNPFASYTSNGFGMAAYLMAYFVPVGIILGHVVAYVAFRTQIAGIWVGVTTAVRYIVGG